MGDNLGSHSVRRFNTNFSSSSFFCRYCNTTQAEFNKNCLCVSQMRSVQTYNTSLQRKLQNGIIDSHDGIKMNSPFNELQFYHVCSPGLPPCSAHDLLEGIVRYDMILYEMHLRGKLKWFSLKFLNQLISTFKFCSFDVRLYPPTISKNSKKLPGNANENGCFLRHFPLLVLSHVTDSENSVWKLILYLKQIIEISVY